MLRRIFARPHGLTILEKMMEKIPRYLSPEQLRVIKSFAQTYFPKDIPENTIKSVVDDLKRDVPGIAISEDDIRAHFQLTIEGDSLKQMIFRIQNTLPFIIFSLIWAISWILKYRIAVFLLSNGRHFRQFNDLTTSERSFMILGIWANSFNPILRILSNTMQKLSVMAFYGSVKESWKAIGFPGQPDELKGKKAREQINQAPKGFKVFGRDLKFPSENLVLDYDAVVVGSGAGGGVAAAKLSKSGRRTLVIEKHGCYIEGNLSHFEDESLRTMYENNGLVFSRDGTVGILAGSSLGGGTTINWSASLQTPEHVRNEWTEEFGLKFCTTSEFQQDLDRACDRIGASTEKIEHNGPNSILMEGCKNLGYPFRIVPQNTRGQVHNCGFCGTGCPTGTKQGTLKTYLADAAKAGAHFMLDSYVEKIIWDKEKRKAIGVLVSSKMPNGNSCIFRVNSKKVVVSCGSLHTPALLKRSGFKNKNIGSNLRLHPSIRVFGVYPDRKINGHIGPMLTTLCSVNEKSVVDGSNYGTAIEAPCFLPVQIAVGAPLPNSVLNVKKNFYGLDAVEPALLRSWMLMYPQMASIFALQRDKDSVGKVGIDSNGKPAITYQISQHDKISLSSGIEKSIEILVAAGAKKIFVSMLHAEYFDFGLDEPSVNNSRLRDFIKKVRSQLPSPPLNSLLFSAHQMGSCRMASDPRSGACNPDGKLWECDGIWICDASLFPTASGVNPMVTTLALAEHVSKSLCSEF